MTNANDPVFPEKRSVMLGNVHDHVIVVQGLTKREYFAAMAMQGMDLNGADPFDKASLAVEFADALISELNKDEVK